MKHLPGLEICKVLRIIAALCAIFIFACSSPSHSEGHIEASTLFPKETELLLSLDFGNFENYSFPGELIEGLKNFKISKEYLSALQKEFDFSITKDFFTWQKGFFYLGIVNTGSASPVGEILNISKNIGKLTQCKINFYEIANSLDEYYLDNDKYPEKLSMLEGRYIHTIPQCPTGTTYAYLTDSSCTKFTLECAHGNQAQGEAKLAYSSERGLKARELTGETESGVNLIIIIPVRNPDNAKSFLERVIARFEQRDKVVFEETTYGGFNLFIPLSRIKASFALGGKYFFFSDNPEIIKASIDTINKKRAAITANPRYLAQSRSYPDNATFSLFLDMMKVVEGSREPLSQDAWKLEFLKSCESLGIWARIERKKIRGESVLTLIPGKITDKLEAMSRNQGNRELFGFVEIFPYNISNFMSLQVQEVLSLFGTFALPSRKTDLAGYTKELLKKRLGISWDDDVKPATSGKIAISYEMGEIIADSLLSKFHITRGTRNLNECCDNLSNMATALDIFAMEHHGRLPEKLESLLPDYLEELPRCPAGGSYAYEKRGDDQYIIHCHLNAHRDAGIYGDAPFYSSSEGLMKYLPEKPEAIRTSTAVPFLIGLEPNSMGSAQKMLNLLAKGHTFRPEEYKDKRIYLDEDESIAYAFIGSFLLIETGGNAPHKLHKLIDASINSRKSLGASGSFKRFGERLSGKVLFIRYDKIDWIASLLRSFLLLAGDDFRDWAEIASEYREAWSAATIHDRNIRVIFDISGD